MLNFYELSFHTKRADHWRKGLEIYKKKKIHALKDEETIGY